MQTEALVPATLRVVIAKLLVWQSEEVRQANIDINVLQDQLITASDIHHWGRATELLTPQTLAIPSQQLQQVITLQSSTCTHRSEVQNLVPSLRIACSGLT